MKSESEMNNEMSNNIDSLDKSESLVHLKDVLNSLTSLKSLHQNMRIKDSEGSIYLEIKSIRYSVKNLIRRIENLNEQ